MCAVISLTISDRATITVQLPVLSVFYTATLVDLSKNAWRKRQSPA